MPNNKKNKKSNIKKTNVCTVVDKSNQAVQESKIYDEKYYGYSHLQAHCGGLGAMMHNIMLAYHYAIVNGLTFAFVKEGMEIPYFNGGISNTDEPNKDYFSYFKQIIPVVETNNVCVWPSCPKGFNTASLNEKTGEKRIIHYAKLMKELFQVRDDIMEIINIEINKYFNPLTDIVIHIRRTDKITDSTGCKESEEIPVSEYFDSTMRVIRTKFSDRKDVRVYLCTDDKTIINELTTSFKAEGIELSYNPEESSEQKQVMRMLNTMTKTDAWRENIVGFLNLIIMSRGLHLIGGRMSYLFRIAELLRYPELPTLNIKDQEKFGVAQYEEIGAKMINAQHKGRYTNFVSDIYMKPRLDLAEMLEQEYIITIPNFITSGAEKQLLSDMSNFKYEWYDNAILPSENKDYKPIYLNDIDKRLASNIKIAHNAADKGQFAYHFKRTGNGKHFNTCTCYACRLDKTFNSYDIMKALSNITGKRVIKMEEIFASNYSNGNFLNMHHDKKKGDYAFVLSLTKNWSPCYGGILNFWDENTNTIYKSCIPTFGNLNIFKLCSEKQIDHFVSRVCTDKSRISWTGWFSIDPEL